MSIVDDFHDQFRQWESATRVALEQLGRRLRVDSDTAGEESLSRALLDQQRLLNEAAGSLPAYDVQRYQSVLAELTSSFSALQLASRPKPRFAFKSKRATSALSGAALDTKPKAAEQPVSDPGQAMITQTPGAMVIQDKDHLLHSVDMTSHKDLQTASTVTLDLLQDCSIDLRRIEPYNSVTLRGLTRCHVQAGTASSSFFMDSCSSCTIHGEAQQFRIHSSVDCQIRYICKTGRPVIEHCHNMKFGNLSGGEATMVDDFSDLSNTRRNWSVLPEFASD